MDDSEEFLEHWEVVRQKGRIRYGISNGIKDCIILLSGCTIITISSGIYHKQLTERYIYIHLSNDVMALVIAIIFGILRGFEGWSKNEKKYNDLMNNKYKIKYKNVRIN